MIKVFKCSSKNYLKQLILFLEKRKNVEKANTKIVSKILREIKTKKIKALLKYELSGDKLFTKLNEKSI